MKQLFALLCLLAALPVLAADRITATLAITNAAGTTNGQTIQIDAATSTTRTWTNSVSVPTTEVLTNSTAAGAATNLYNHLVAAQPIGVAPIVMSSATNVVLYGQSGINLVLTLSEGWGTVTYSTQSVTTAYNVRIPNTAEASAQRTNIASALTTYLNLDANTNQVSQSAPWAAQLLGTTNTQTLAGIKYFTNVTGEWRGIVSNSPAISGTVNTLTNGSWRTGGLISPAVTNATIWGTNTYNSGEVQLWTSADGVVFYSAGADAVILAMTNQVLTLSGDTKVVGQVAGDSNKVFLAGTGGYLGLNYLTVMTNGTLSGMSFDRTNTFPAQSDIAFGRYANTSLANGANSAVLVGTNVFVEVSGPSAAFSIAGINGSPNRDGKFLVVLNQTGYALTFLHQSGLDATAANRIITPTGVDMASAGSCAALLIYNGSSSRWQLLSLINNAASSAYASLACATGAVASAASAGPNTFAGWSKSTANGAIGVVSATYLYVTNAGSYDYEFGGGIISGNGDTCALILYTNNFALGAAGQMVNEPILEATMAATAVYETGFKAGTISLAANTALYLVTTNSDTSAQSLKNACFRIRRVQ